MQKSTGEGSRSVAHGSLIFLISGIGYEIKQNKTRMERRNVDEVMAMTPKRFGIVTVGVVDWS